MRWLGIVGVGVALAQPSPRVSLGSGLPPVAPIPPLGIHGPGLQMAPRRAFFGFPLIYPLPWQPAYAYPPPSTVVVVSQPPGPESRRAPWKPEPARPELRQYEWPASEVKEAAFAIVLRDGRRFRAALAWVQDERLRICTPEGDSREFPLTAIDREKTIEVNREAGLKLFLPAIREGVLP